jgi:hypothetical protein
MNFGIIGFNGNIWLLKCKYLTTTYYTWSITTFSSDIYNMICLPRHNYQELIDLLLSFFATK